MKPLKLIAILLSAIVCAITSTNAQTLSVHLKNGNVVNYTEAELDYIQFSESTQGDDPAELSVVGTWHNYIRTEIEWGNTPIIIEENTYWQFKSDGTCICIVDNGDDVDFSRSTWERNGNTLTLNHPGESETMTILTLTNDTLIVTEMGFTYEFKRVADSTIDKYL